MGLMFKTQIFIFLGLILGVFGVVFSYKALKIPPKGEKPETKKKSIYMGLWGIILLFFAAQFFIFLYSVDPDSKENFHEQPELPDLGYRDKFSQNIYSLIRNYK